MNGVGLKNTESIYSFSPPSISCLPLTTYHLPPYSIPQNQGIAASRKG